MSDLNLYWGDIHNHNELGYGMGSLARSYETAKSHLDFYAFTPHGLHAEGDARDGYPIVVENWGAIQEAARTHNRPGQFTAFLANEWHSTTWGHVHVIYDDDDRPMHLARTLSQLQEMMRDTPGILVPHHIAYQNGVDWERFDPSLSPIVEIFSEHGCSERDHGPFPMLGHSGGPGPSCFTAQAGLSRGHRFGFSAGTDNHDGHPGGYGLGLTGVWAPENTREAVMGAIRGGKTIAVTGDRISMWLTANDQMMGESVSPSEDLNLACSVEGWDALNTVELIRSNGIAKVWTQDELKSSTEEDTYRFRVEYGWGPMKGYQVFDWIGELSVENGELVQAVPCFSSDPFDEDRRKRINRVDERRCEWQSHTSRGGIFVTRNSHTPSSAQDAVCFEVRGDRSTRIALNIRCGTRKSLIATPSDWSIANASSRKHESFTLGDLMEGRQGWRMGKPSTWVLVHRAVGRAHYAWTREWTETRPGEFYYLRATQNNGQMGWSSPIWIA